MEDPDILLRDELIRRFEEGGQQILSTNFVDLAREEREYLTTADPKDIATYRTVKKLGILLVVDKNFSKQLSVGNMAINENDRALELHIPPKIGTKINSLKDITESLQLVSDYISLHGLKPKYVYGCTYEPIVATAEKRYGFKTIRTGISPAITGNVLREFHEHADPNREPVIGFIYSTLTEFKKRFPPRTQA